MRRQKHDCCIKTEKQFYVGSRVFLTVCILCVTGRCEKTGAAKLRGLAASTGRQKKQRFLCRNAQKKNLFDEGFKAVIKSAHSVIIRIERDNLLKIILRFAVVGFFIVDFVEAE